MIKLKSHQVLHLSSFLVAVLGLVELAHGDPATLKAVVPMGQCVLITMASKDDATILSELQKYRDFAPIGVRSNNGFTAAAVGIYNTADGQQLAKTLKAEGRIPPDSYCGNSERFVQLVYPDKTFKRLQPNQETAYTDVKTLKESGVSGTLSLDKNGSATKFNWNEPK